MSTYEHRTPYTHIAHNNIFIIIFFTWLHTILHMCSYVWCMRTNIVDNHIVVVAYTKQYNSKYIAMCDAHMIWYCTNHFKCIQKWIIEMLLQLHVCQECVCAHDVQHLFRSRMCTIVHNGVRERAFTQSWVTQSNNN